MRLARSKAIAAAVAGPLAIGIGMRYPGDAAEFTYKWSCDVAADHPLFTYATEATRNVLRDSNGRLEVRAFPNGQLGGQAQMVPLLRTGAVEMATSFDAVTEAVVPICGITAIPFAFANHHVAWRAIGGPLNAYVRNAISKVGLYACEQSWDIGFRQIETNVRPVSEPKDLAGLKLRIPPSATETVLFKGLNASPTDVNAAELYGAIQTHLVDGLAIPLYGLAARKMWDVLKYVSLSNHILSNYRLIANVDAMQRLPKDLRDVLERNANASGARCSNYSDHADIALQPQLKANGMIFNDVDRPAFKSAIRAASLYAQWRQRYGEEVWRLLESGTNQRLA